jgi:phenylacetate-CoA ligase
MHDEIPADILQCSPLIDAEGLRTLDRLRQHRQAPRWRHQAGDWLQRQDLAALEVYRRQLGAERGRRQADAPSQRILRWLQEMWPKVPALRQRIPAQLDPAEHWSRLPTFGREDISRHPESLVPEDAELEQMIVYRTAGTTGHALLVPHHPRAAACYQPLIEHALARHGVAFEPQAGTVACFLVGAQVRTVTYPTVLAAWRGAGFAKLNLLPAEWQHPEDPHGYFASLQPTILTGDPISFAEMVRLRIPARPRAMISTAVAMSHGLKRRLSAHYGCPVIDWYSLTETGPIGYACPLGEGYHLLPHDLHVEVLERDGQPAPTGQRGEITVSGGRNPYLPLLRYRTGDWGRLDLEPCACGDPMPRLLDLEGRPPVLFRAADGSLVNPVDVSRVLRELPLVQHELHQGRDLSCTLVARPADGAGARLPDQLARALRGLLGDVPISVRLDPGLGNRPDDDAKPIPYRSELLLED